MKKSLKITLIVVLALAVGIGAAAIGIYAAIRPWTTYGGQVGEHVYYAYNADAGEVLVYGQGDMWHFIGTLIGDKNQHISSPLDDSYSSRKLPVSRVVIAEGVTNLSPEFLPEQTAEIWLPESMELVDCLSFMDQKELENVYVCADAPLVSDLPFFTLREGEKIVNHLFTEVYDDWETEAIPQPLSFYSYRNPATGEWEEASPTIHRQPGTAGWDAETWQSCTVVEEKFHLPLKYRLVAWYLETFCEAPEGVTGTLWGQFPETEGKSE